MPLRPIMGNLPSHPTLESIRVTLRRDGYTEASIEDIIIAIYTLASYGIINLHLGAAQLAGIGCSSTSPIAKRGALTCNQLAAMLCGSGGNTVRPRPSPAELLLKLARAKEGMDEGYSGHSNPLTAGSADGESRVNVKENVGMNAGTDGMASVYDYSGNGLTNSYEYNSAGSARVDEMARNNNSGFVAADGQSYDSYANYYSSYYNNFNSGCGANNGSAEEKYSGGSGTTSGNQNSFGLETDKSGYSASQPQGYTALQPSAASGPATGAASKTSQNIEVAEHLIGGILGPGGKGILDLQQYSGATVEISKKGVFAPGMQNRIVTITGPETAVQTACYWIQQYLQAEEYRRAYGGYQPEQYEQGQYTQQQGQYTQEQYLPPQGQYMQQQQGQYTQGQFTQQQAQYMHQQ